MKYILFFLEDVLIKRSILGVYCDDLLLRFRRILEAMELMCNGMRI